MKSREFLPADSVQNASVNTGAGRFCLILAIFAISFVFNVQDAMAGCARERHLANEVDMQAISGLSKDQLVLMPRSIWDYSAGTIKITFVVPAKPCDGCHCRQPAPTQDPDFHTIVESSVRLPSPISCGIVSSRDNDRDGGDLIREPQFLYSTVERSPLERPPNTL